MLLTLRTIEHVANRFESFANSERTGAATVRPAGRVRARATPAGARGVRARRDVRRP
jgi:hypothetical protein